VGSGRRQIGVRVEAAHPMTARGVDQMAGLMM
jgi:hypothetical protein